ncbi:thymidine kinase [Klebsiella phage vB_KpM_FBKp24]|uniref:Thymidine kinase n=1 Tax=Klebsiella phage vB_KpM_FBKp24 TaxID=2801834 RepID=A0A7U0J748_9CAUD|nr:thymidine kinase [Klebsiella phage vB_KpM_FBKp24]QQV92142.1 thymidine kinase [Klebsiella phage vB_KpM_FBKp24]
MALIYRFGAMNSSKSSNLLQTAYNYRERGMEVDIFKPAIDTRDEKGKVSSRIGLSGDCVMLDKNTSFLTDIYKDRQYPKVILVDEAQFLEPFHVYELRSLADLNDVTVLCYGLRTDFQREAFPASAILLAIADKLEEIPTVCWCGKKARFVLRLNDKGEVVVVGPQVQIGGNDSYISVCSKHWALQQPSESEVDKK